MKFNKFTTYEFEIEVPDSSSATGRSNFSVEYKIDNDNAENSTMKIHNIDNHEMMTIRVPLLKKLNESMQEVDPFSVMDIDED